MSGPGCADANVAYMVLMAQLIKVWEKGDVIIIIIIGLSFLFPHRNLVTHHSVCFCGKFTNNLRLII